jgi:hypothetical protein
VNGDGFADVLVAAALNDAGGNDAGRVYLYHGGPGADAIADLVFTGEAAGDQLGVSAFTAGDVNGDGYDDIVIGAWLSDAAAINAGRAYLYYGGPFADPVPDLVLSGTIAEDNFGYTSTTAGDVNHDGHADLLITAPQFGISGGNGRAYVFYGGPNIDPIADLTISGSAGEGLGSWADAAGDVNGDGNDDIIVGAHRNDGAGIDAGRAYVFYGGPGVLDATPDLTLSGEAAGDFFGTVARAGDVNGDGYDELLVGADRNDAGGPDAGRAYLFLGGPFADQVPDLILTGAAAGDRFGRSPAPAGDVNGDGYADILVSAHLNDAGGAAAGRVYVYHGGPGLDAVPDVILTGARAGDQFGFVAYGAGDVNGDGFDDVISGAVNNDLAGADFGRAYVTLIYPYEILSPNGCEQWVAGESATVRWLGHDPADLYFSADGGATWDLVAAGIGGTTDNHSSLAVPAVQTEGAMVRLSYAGQPPRRSTSDQSDAPFRIVQPWTPPKTATRTELVLTGSAPQDAFGRAARSAGDVNGDGFPDLLVGIPFHDGPGLDAGRAHLYLGGAAGVDGAPDLVLVGEAAGDLFGFQLDSAGDMNGDGFDDIAVASRTNDAGGPNAGRVYVYFGGLAPNAIPDLVLTGEAPQDLFGCGVAGAGDVDGDGLGDLVVGARQNDAAGANAGRAYIYYGSRVLDGTADRIFNGEAANDLFGVTVDGAGDVNGDGYDEVIVGATTNDAGGVDAGRAYVFLGGPAGGVEPDFIATGEAPGDIFGNSVAGAGDVDGDGRDDFLVGAQLNDAGGADAGRAYLYLGAGPCAARPDFGVNPHFAVNPDWIVTGDNFEDGLGFAVSGAGDVNADGYADLIISAVNDDAGALDTGRADIFFGGPGIDERPDIVLAGEAPSDFFGISVAAAGDLNADGHGDVIIGSLENDAGGLNAGRAYVYDHNRYHLLSPNGGETWNVGAMQTISWLGSGPVDIHLSVDGGRSYGVILENTCPPPTHEEMRPRTVTLRVPHAPTRHARVRVSTHAEEASDPCGDDESDSTMTIQSMVGLLRFAGEPDPDGGVALRWTTEPGVGPEGLLGYRLYRLLPGNDLGTRIGPELITANEYLDREGGTGASYRLAAVNGLGEELEIGRASLGAPFAGIRAWPSPVAIGGDLAVAFAAPLGALGLPVSDLDVGIYSVLGRRVATLARGQVRAEDGVVRLSWRVGAGDRVAPGIYFVRAVAPSAGFILERKVVVGR